MSIKRKTFSRHLQAKQLTYPDEFFVLKSEKDICSDSFPIYRYAVLEED